MAKQLRKGKNDEISPDISIFLKAEELKGKLCGLYSDSDKKGGNFNIMSTVKIDGKELKLTSLTSVTKLLFSLSSTTSILLENAKELNIGDNKKLVTVIIIGIINKQIINLPNPL